MLNKPAQINHFPHSTRNTHFMPLFALFASPLLALFLSGCSTTQPKHSTESSTIVALINTHPITAADLYPHFAETVGDQILTELILTHLLDTIAVDSHWTITDTDIQNEIDNLITTIAQSTDPQYAQQTTPRLIQTIRHRRGLGPTRFNALLRRNAILRKLIINNPILPEKIQTHIQTAIAQLPSPPTPDQLKDITHRATLVAQQQTMESYAQTLINQNDVLILDRALKWSRE